MVVIDGIKWDFGPDDDIEYFDPTKSYYITKYRPIDKTNGLDFNPDWFREDAINKLKTGNYTPQGIIKGSKAHRDWWKERMRRCEEGLEINGYRLTGDNYFWLNYYRLKSPEAKGKKASSGRNFGFPMFFTYQYEYFHYLEMCELLKKDSGLLKSRGIGFSEIGAVLCTRPFITTRYFRVVASAFSERHLKPLLSKIWTQLSFLNSETDGAFKRVCMMINTGLHKRASKKNKDGTEASDSHGSEIEGIVADSPEKIRGDRTERLLYEEAGSDKIFETKWIQGEALVKVMEEKIGTKIGWGTGGDKGDAVEGIRKMVNNPEAWNILPYRHNHTPNGLYIDTAMFIPAYRTVLSLMDNRGWCDPDLGKEHYNKIRKTKSNDPSSLLKYMAEYCFTIEEALILQGDNIFPKEELAEQAAAIEIYKTTPEVHSGALTWEIDKQTEERTGRVKWREDINGKVKIIEHPLMSPDGADYRNLYVGGIDSIDIGTADSASADGNSKLSDFCIVIKKRVLGLNNPSYVAMYKDRPRDPREAYEIAAKLLTYYGCQAVLESTRTAILTYFRDTKRLNLLMKRPRATMPDVSKGNSNMYGSPATLKVIEHYRELIYDFCLDYANTIAFKEMIDQLLNYSDAEKKKFDIVAAMGMAELGDEEMSVKKPTPKEPKGKGFRDVGWYKDDRGYKHYGVIPQTEEERNVERRPSQWDSWLYKDTI